MTTSKRLTRTENRGGKREGSGRPPVLARQLAEAKELAKQLHLDLHAGLQVLGREYPNLMELAIDLARGSTEREPNVRLLQALLELLPRIVGEAGADADSPIARLLKDLTNAKSVTLHQENVYNYGLVEPEVVEDGSRASSPRVE